MEAAAATFDVISYLCSPAPPTLFFLLLLLPKSCTVFLELLSAVIFRAPSCGSVLCSMSLIRMSLPRSTSVKEQPPAALSVLLPNVVILQSAYLSR